MIFPYPEMGSPLNNYLTMLLPAFYLLSFGLLFRFLYLYFAECRLRLIVRR